ncbi:TPR repeat-containing protein [Oribacterium sp. KHPX15]|uniref:tetratricopeptide repeat protein n=1 Tax=Oribacterium sp. KHPX15 TaxID=1855342 RepID=UPI00089D76FA|nr:tetratricopeptide repeat protein [Oribacterium sp. KHPX15]SDZ96053.1 TPR repeat-containing protein [Oribacterium sp. KHPX15]
MNKKIYTLLIEFLLLVCLCACASNAQKIQKQLEIGNKFLADLEFEQAILSFNKVIDIDPKNIDAYRGLGDAYYGEIKDASDYNTIDMLYLNSTKNYGIIIDLINDGTGTTTNDISLEEISKNVQEILLELYCEWSELAIKEGDSDHAVNILKDGYTILGNDELLEKSQTISNIREVEKIVEDLDITSEGFNILDSGNVDKIIALTDMFNGKYISCENGNGFGLYKIDGSYYLFCGSFEKGLREGPGLLVLIVNDGNDTYVKCEWKEDVPYGRAEYYNGSSSEEFYGNFQLINGLYDGEGTYVFNPELPEYSTKMIFTVNKGNIVNLGIDPDVDHYSGYTFYCYAISSESTDAAYFYQFQDFEVTRGMPGYADSFRINNDNDSIVLVMGTSGIKLNPVE